MKKTFKKTTSQWIDFIAQQELPAITSTARLLDSFSNDDVSSLPKLSQAILHDQALSSCLLKIANNIAHIGHNKVTTVSRATVVLGIHSVKNICLTSKLIDGLLSNEDLAPDVVARITQLMANSFYAGLLARMMVPEHDEQTQEEVYLAAMLYRIGETAFWSSAGEAADELIEYTKADDFDQHCQAIIGTQFSQLSTGLARVWNLGNLLEKSLDHPESRAVEMQIIALADKLSCYIDQPPETAEEFNQVLTQISQIKGIDVGRLRKRIEHTRQSAVELLSSYGAEALTDLIKPLPTITAFSRQKQHEHVEVLSPEKVQLNALMQLTQLTQTSHDFNDYLQLAMKAMVQSLTFDRTLFMMPTADKSQVKVRFALNNLGQTDHTKMAINISESQNILSYVLKSAKAVVINDYKELQWRNYMSKAVSQWLAGSTVCMAPVKVNNKVIGIIVGQFFEHTRSISDEEFQHFSYYVQHLNMCLSLISQR
ncbi:HDOD domain-containing protein [Thalassotalea sp. PLHSN55]|uniref:HDOD domain-containing protein n=1 Tax=Thalassotalea sp. PLHSN55 TaxID=3435888 RepID=UPI003F83A566